MEYHIPEDMPINKTYSLRMVQIAQVSDLSRRLGKDQSEIVREAISEYYLRYQDEKIEILPEMES